MIAGDSKGHCARGSGGRRGSRRRTWRTRRGVSDVVATILLLALTVVLFASIFAFVTSFPGPPAQNSNQFQAALNTGPNGSATEATSVTITHLAGPSISQTAQIYLKSSRYPNGPEFALPYSLVAGGLSPTQVWNLGQTWVLSSNFTGGFHPIIPDNITIYVVAGSSLLFSVVLPGTVINVPPTFLSVGTSPSVPALGEAFQIQAAIQGVTATSTVTVVVSNLGSSLPTGGQTMKLDNGVWVYNVTAGLTAASGTFYAFITATTPGGKIGTSSVPVFITPYSTLIANAFTLGTATYGLCSKTTTHTPVAACLVSATQQYYFSVTISASAIDFGGILLEVETTATKAAYATVAAAVFAIALTSTATTPVVTWTDSVVTGPLIITSSWTTAYTSPATSLTPLTTLYTISVNVGTTLPSATAGTLSFLALGQGAYSSQTAALSLPAS